MSHFFQRIFNAGERAFFYGACTATLYCPVFAQEPYLADTSLKPYPDARRISLWFAIVAIILIATWFFKKPAGRRHSILLILFGACLSVAIALPLIPVYRDHFPIVIATHDMKRGDIIGAADVEMVEAKHGQVLNRLSNKLDEAIGQVVKHRIKKGQAIEEDQKSDGVVATRDFVVGQVASPEDFKDVKKVSFKGRLGNPATSISRLVGLQARHPVKAGTVIWESDFHPPPATPEQRQSARESNLQEINNITERINHGDGIDWYGSRSSYYSNLGKFDLALKDHEVYMKQDLPAERKREALLQKSDLLYRLKQYSESIKTLSELPAPEDWEKKRQSVQLKMRTGRAKLAMGQTKLALLDFNAAYDALDGDPPGELLYYRSVANEKLGNEKAAAADRAEMDILGYEPEKINRPAP